MIQGADGKATDVTVVGIAGIQNGESVLALSDGTTRPAEEVTFGNQETKNLYGMARAYTETVFEIWRGGFFAGQGAGPKE